MADKTLLVPLDGSEHSERGLSVAAQLADRMHAGLLLVTAAEGGPLRPGEYLEEQAASLRSTGSKVDTLARRHAGRRARARGRRCRRPDRVHDHPRPGPAAMGGARQRCRGVAASYPHPMVLVGRHCRDDFLARSSRSVACVDGVTAAASLAPAVDEWAGALGLSTDVAVVVHPLDVVSAERETELLAELRAPFASATHDVMLSNRFASGALADLADTEPAALVAMSRARAAGGLSRVALGSVTMGLVHLVSCPVVVRHADGIGDVRLSGAGS